MQKASFASRRLSLIGLIGLIGLIDLISLVDRLGSLNKLNSCLVCYRRHVCYIIRLIVRIIFGRIAIFLPWAFLSDLFVDLRINSFTSDVE